MKRYYPDKKEFMRLSKRGNIIPVYREIYAGLETPLSAFSKIDDKKHSFLLESMEGEEKIGRYSFLGSRPSVIIESKGNKITITTFGAKRFVKRINGNPFSEIEKFMSRYKFVAVKGLPRFSGGLVGYIGYDAVRFIEKIPDSCKDDLKLSDAKLILADTLLEFDHATKTIKIISNARIPGRSKKAKERAYAGATKRIDAIAERLKKPSRAKLPRIKTGRPIKFKSNMKKSTFKKSVLRAKEYIKKGDIIQVVLSQRFSTDYKKDPLNIYRALRSINPSPYMFYLSFGKIKLIGSSPEIMVRGEEGIAEIRPIAGTRRRGKTPQEDKRLEKELLKDPKECSEHIMLVDLGRNDLGRVCDKGSIMVNDFMVIERYSHVMHIVSDCVGRLLPESSAVKLLEASFPAGTVSGAPKIRAMEIIDELENTKRAAYAGCVGYFSFSGNLDTCITIRTVLIRNKRAYVQAGAGIVAGSDPEREYQETVNKAKGMFKAISAAKAVK